VRRGEAADGQHEHPIGEGDGLVDVVRAAATTTRHGDELAGRHLEVEPVENDVLTERPADTAQSRCRHGCGGFGGRTRTRVGICRAEGDVGNNVLMDLYHSSASSPGSGSGEGGRADVPHTQEHQRCHHPAQRPCRHPTARSHRAGGADPSTGPGRCLSN
jgi:hypothetical protein